MYHRRHIISNNNNNIKSSREAASTKTATKTQSKFQAEGHHQKVSLRGEVATVRTRRLPIVLLPTMPIIPRRQGHNRKRVLATAIWDHSPPVSGKQRMRNQNASDFSQLSPRRECRRGGHHGEMRVSLIGRRRCLMA